MSCLYCVQFCVLVLDRELNYVSGDYLKWLYMYTKGRLEGDAK